MESPPQFEVYINIGNKKSRINYIVAECYRQYKYDIM